MGTCYSSTHACGYVSLELNISDIKCLSLSVNREGQKKLTFMTLPGIRQENVSTFENISQLMFSSQVCIEFQGAR